MNLENKLFYNSQKVVLNYQEWLLKYVIKNYNKIKIKIIQ